VQVFGRRFGFNVYHVIHQPFGEQLVEHPGTHSTGAALVPKITFGNVPGEHSVVITYLIVVLAGFRKLLFADFVLIRRTRTERTEFFVVVLRCRKYIGVFQSRLILPVVVHNDFERALFRHGTGTAAYTVAVRDNGIVQCLGALVGRHFEANFLEVRSLSRSRISISSRRVGLISKHSAG